ncbi:sigma-70 family RNA polymerase sigma factor [Erysipelothrix sp. HDW6C]|uniref:sigma-70 family RNA polymerase sigma factor n=1 Tax=Erysipelothrix sp. HDW6C TaxID=2714930 RepID=UPI00140D2D10|nr:sigma-70 family RNA polymerase sigma factor [Erysipelothrix sp. HDW6C]QIK68863.1 sigma-70 family RNA polymerase sigma factor [Erysipelothrix sp. HDW6C]
MIGDYEYLYMIRQHNNDAMEIVFDKFKNLLWRRAHDFMAQQHPQGVTVEDMFQEAAVGFVEAIYAYREDMNVGFAYFINICVESSIRTALRKCRSRSYTQLDNRLSLDMVISEDGALFLSDVIEDKNIRNDPYFMMQYFEGQVIQSQTLATISDTERYIYTLKEDGFTYHEIAILTRKSTKFIDNTLQKIRHLMVRNSYE